MTQKTVPIKNIIFDLGNVLIDLDFNKTLAAYAALGIDNPKERMGREEDNRFFRQYETGKVTTADTIAHIRGFSSNAPRDEEITAAFNAMLLDFPPERLTLLESLKRKYKLFLFSNINDMHHAHVHHIYRSKRAGSLDDHFEKAYYSHLIGRRKPDPASFMYVVNDAGITANETLFIDDLAENTHGAGLAGLQTAHLAPGQSILDLKLIAG